MTGRLKQKFLYSLFIIYVLSFTEKLDSAKISDGRLNFYKKQKLPCKSCIICSKNPNGTIKINLRWCLWYWQQIRHCKRPIYSYNKNRVRNAISQASQIHVSQAYTHTRLPATPFFIPLLLFYGWWNSISRKENCPLTDNYQWAYWSTMGRGVYGSARRYYIYNSLWDLVTDGSE